MGTGLAFALKYKNMHNACFTMYGDGTANQGQLFEAANMAGLWKLPVVYVIENNRYGMGTSVKRASHYTDLMGKFRGFPGLRIDGMDVFAVREASKFCKEYVIKNGPMFLEIDTYRYQGHSMSDPGITYRTKEEVTDVRENKDCISKIKQYILNNNYATEEELKDIEKKIRSQIEEDIKKIKEDPYPEPSELYTNMYVDDEHDAPFVRGIEYSQSIFREHKQ
jgi:pyruvate dehydrogenase E1 component alpha subunit